MYALAQTALGKDLIEAVEVSLSFSMMDNPGFLQEVCPDVAPLSIKSMIIPDVHVLPLMRKKGKTRGKEGRREREVR